MQVVREIQTFDHEIKRANLNYTHFVFDPMHLMNIKTCKIDTLIIFFKRKITLECFSFVICGF